MKQNVTNTRLSTRVVDEYSDDTLCGYADKEFAKGGEIISEQQRGLILPMLEKIIIQKTGKKLEIVEIGTGNGDVIAHLAKKFPEHSFIGVDFSIRIAEEKHRGITNLKFIKGYALDLLEKRKISGNIIFSSSTFCLFTPLELENYLVNLRKNSFEDIVINEPSWAGYAQENSDSTISKHLDAPVWFHNYCGYFVKAGYKVIDLEFFKYKHQMSTSPDIDICLLHGQIS